MSKKVLVLKGGFSAEREVSLVTGDGVEKALRHKGYEVISFDLTNVWDLIAFIQREKPDVVFNALHGNWGEDGEIQAFFDVLQIPYTHSGVKTSVIGMDKYLTKQIARSQGIKTAADEKTTARKLAVRGTVISLPYVVKPVADGSSVGVFIVKTPEEAREIRYDDPDREILIEKYIPGRELTVMCLEGRAYAVTELRAAGGFYNYKAKYTDGVTQHVLPAEIPDEVAATCKEYAEKIHRALGCRMVSRSDFRWNETDGVVFLEINTNPGMTKLSLVPEQAKYAGIDYATLCAKLVENAECRKIN